MATKNHFKFQGPGFKFEIRNVGSDILDLRLELEILKSSAVLGLELIENCTQKKQGFYSTIREFEIASPVREKKRSSRTTD
jgi:hypothetical protein